MGQNNEIETLTDDERSHVEELMRRAPDLLTKTLHIIDAQAARIAELEQQVVLWRERADPVRF